MSDVSSVNRIQTEAMNDAPANNWWAAAIRGVLATLFGIIGALVLTFWAGAHVLVLCATLLILACRLREHRTERPHRVATADAA